MKDSNIQIKFTHIFMLVFFTLLALYFRQLERLEDYFIYGATVMISLHFWKGAVFFVRTLGPSKDILGHLTDLAIMGLKVGSIYSIRNMSLWFLLNSMIMGLGITKYRMALGYDNSPKREDFIRSKISIEIPLAFILFVIAMITWCVDSDMLRKILGGFVFGIQPIFLFWALFKKKLYERS